MMPVGLLRKEFRQILPWALAIWGTSLLAELWSLLFVALDSHVWAETTPIFESGGRAATLSLWALILAYAGFPREHDDGTLAFLFTLPVRRSSLFAAKAGAAAGVLLGVVAVDELLSWARQLPNDTSFGGHTFRLEWALVSLGMSAAFALVALGYALFLAVFRRFGLLLALVVATVLAWLKQRRPALRWVNPLTLLDLDFHGTAAIMPWKALAFHGCLALLLSAIAAYVWLGPLEAWSSRLRRWVTSTSAKVVFAVGTLAGLVALAFQFEDFFKEPTQTFGTLPELDTTETRLASRRYRFRCPESMRGRIERLARSADALHDRILPLLSTQPGAVIEVNLMGASPSHAGSATWNTIRLDLRHAYSDRDLERTLVHETAHVIALRLSDRRVGEHGESLRFFDEGLAEHLAWTLVPSAEGMQARWLEACLAKQRLRIEATDLFDQASFRARFGELPLYPLGLAWARALLDSCGSRAPDRLLRALAKPERPKDLRGRQLWQDALQAIGCDLNRVTLRWGELLKEKCAELRAELDKTPSLAGGITGIEGEDIVLTAEISGRDAEACTFAVNTRGSEADGHGAYLRFGAERAAAGSAEFLVPSDLVDEEMLQFQFTETCLRNDVTFSSVEKWQRARVPAR
jgi:hypothetical protein